MADALITLIDGKERCVATINNETITVGHRDPVYWDVLNHCATTHSVELRGLPPHVTGTRPVRVPGNGGTGQIGGRANQATQAEPKKYDIYVDGVRAVDPYIVIEEARGLPTLSRALALIAAIGAGYLAYRSVESMLQHSTDGKRLGR